MKQHETTLILVKPDAVAQGLTGEVLQRLEKNGFKILNCRMLRLTPALLQEHYAHLASLPFFPEIETFMASGPVVAVACGSCSDRLTAQKPPKERSVGI